MTNMPFELIDDELTEAYQMGYADAAQGCLAHETRYTDQKQDAEWLRGWCDYQQEKRRAVSDTVREYMHRS